MLKSGIAGAALLAGSVASAAIYDETVDGDLSGDRFAPTMITLDQGMNTVSMDVVLSDQPGGDRDYFTFTLGAGQSIDSMVILESSNPLGGSDSAAFVGFGPGSFFDFDPDIFSGPGLDGFVITSPGFVGVEVINDLTGGLNSIGPGSYSFWVQQTGQDLTRVSIGLNVIPSPSAMGVLAMGGLVAMRRRR
ncbi:MAG: hypothetical protein JJ974_11700 [Phycisphaerales bacterium]|nr:hypothetical protein [Phycisphaerales bacterium]